LSDAGCSRPVLYLTVGIRPPWAGKTAWADAKRTTNKG
jgi:hypothetical protein